MNQKKTTSPSPIEPRYQYHEFADLYPIMPDEEVEDLAESIRLVGLKEAIVLCEEKILDGRHRDMACHMAGVEPCYTNFDGTREEAFNYVVAMNEHRRHLSSSQRAAIAVEKEEMYNAIEEVNKEVRASTHPKKGKKGFQSQSSVPQLIAEHKRDPNYHRETAARIAKVNKTNRQ